MISFYAKKNLKLECREQFGKVPPYAFYLMMFFFFFFWIFGSKLKSVKWEVPLRWIWIVDYHTDFVAELKENRLKSIFGRVQASKASDCVLGIRIGGA